MERYLRCKPFCQLLRVADREDAGRHRQRATAGQIGARYFAAVRIRMQGTTENLAITVGLQHLCISISVCPNIFKIHKYYCEASVYLAQIVDVAAFNRMLSWCHVP